MDNPMEDFWRCDFAVNIESFSPPGLAVKIVKERGLCGEISFGGVVNTRFLGAERGEVDPLDGAQLQLFINVNSRIDSKTAWPNGIGGLQLLGKQEKSSVRSSQPVAFVFVDVDLLEFDYLLRVGADLRQSENPMALIKLNGELLDNRIVSFGRRPSIGELRREDDMYFSVESLLLFEQRGK